MSTSQDRPNNLHSNSPEREPEELTDEELEYVVGGLDPAAALMRFQVLFSSEPATGVD